MSRSACPACADFARDPAAIVAIAKDLAVADAPHAACTAIRCEIGRLASVPARTLLGEMEAALCAPNAAAILRMLEALGALALLLPEVQAFVRFHQGSPVPHKDLWAHTLTVLERIAPEPDLRWIALCHDIGKIATRAVGADGRLGFHRHEAVGARLFVGIGARFAMASERVARIAFVIEHHARTNQFEPCWSDRALRRLIRDSGEHLPLMLAFSAADWTTKKAARAERIQRHIELLRERLEAIGAAPPAQVLPAGLARALLDVVGAAPGPWVGEALRWAAQEAKAGRLAGLDANAIAIRCASRSAPPSGESADARAPGAAGVGSAARGC